MKKPFLIHILPFLCVVPAVAIGSFVMYVQGVGFLIYGQNIAALILGSAISFLYLATPNLFVPKRMEDRWVYILVFLSIGGLLWTFANPGLEGVHRWIKIGPVSINGAFIFLPVALITMDILWSEGKWLVVLVLVVSIAGILFLQPDASMVTALTMAVVPMVFLRIQSRKVQMSGFVLLLLLTIFAWMKPDPLEPVDYVEGILRMAWERGWGYWLAGIVSLLILFCPFGIAAVNKERRPFCVGCAMFYLGTLLSSVIGAYPIPVMGYGVSPIIGYLILASYEVQRFNVPRRGSDKDLDEVQTTA